MALTKVTGQVINNSTGLVVGVTTVGGGLSATDGFFSGIVTAVGDASFSGNVSVGGTLTYEDVTNIDAVGLVTARNGIVVGSGITLSKDGDGFFTGVVTATSYSGDGSGLTGIAATDNVRTGILDVAGIATFRADAIFNADVRVTDSIIHEGDTNTKIRFPSADTISFETDGSQRLRIASTGRLSILNNNEDIDMDSSSSGQLHIDGNGYSGAIALNATAMNIYTNASSRSLILGTNETERLRITNTGNVEIDSFNSPSTRTLSLRTDYLANANGGIGLAAKDHSGAAADGLGVYGTDGVSIHTANAGTVYERLRITTDGTFTNSGTNNAPTSGSGWGFTLDQLYLSTAGTSANYALRFYNDNGLVGSVLVNGSGVTYNTSSDYRLKENQVSISDAISKVKQLKPYTFNFKSDSTTKIDGFFAHEAQEVVPHAVSGEKDGEQMQSMDYGKLTPLLTAALQEAISEIETLKTEVAALKSQLNN